MCGLETASIRLEVLEVRYPASRPRPLLRGENVVVRGTLAENTAFSAAQ